MVSGKDVTPTRIVMLLASVTPSTLIFVFGRNHDTDFGTLVVFFSS